MNPSIDLKDISRTIVLVGAGKMGTAMLQGWLTHGLDPAGVAVLEPQPSEDMRELTALGVRLNPTNPVKEAGAIVVAVKPQVAESVVPTLAAMCGPSTVI